MPNLENLPIGKIGLIQQTDDGRIVQLGLNEEQSEVLHLFLASLSNDKPLTRLPKDYDLVLKRM